MISIYSNVLLRELEKQEIEAKIILKHQKYLCIFVLFYLQPYYFFRFACCQLDQE